MRPMERYTVEATVCAELREAGYPLCENCGRATYCRGVGYIVRHIEEDIRSLSGKEEDG